MLGQAPLQLSVSQLGPSTVVSTPNGAREGKKILRGRYIDNFSWLFMHSRSGSGRGSGGGGDAGGGGHGRAEALVEEPEATDDCIGLSAGLGEGRGGIL